MFMAATDREDKDDDNDVATIDPPSFIPHLILIACSCSSQSTQSNPKAKTLPEHQSAIN